MQEVSLNRSLIHDFLHTARNPGEYSILDRVELIIDEAKKLRSYKAHEGYSAQRRIEVINDKIDQQMKEKRRQEEIEARKQELIEMEQGEHIKLLKEISTRVNGINKLTDMIEMENQEATNKLEQAQVEQKKQKIHFDNHPMDRMKDIMEEWAAEPVYSQDEIENLRGELWFSLEEFEKRLENSNNYFKIEK